MQVKSTYDIAIVGGGLAGLACAIQLQTLGHSVVLLEKERYPFHKVCGEYISLESWGFLEGIGVPLQSFDLPVIKQLLLTAPNGNSFSTLLPLGGFGISRYLLDSTLASIAKEKGVTLLEATKVDAIHFDNNFSIRFSSAENGSATINTKVCCAAYGKRSNLDVKWRRQFLQRQDKRLQNFIGIKYHIASEWDERTIGLHNFKDGYCGISKIEGERYCLCYMTKASNLKACGNDIQQLEKNILNQNPFLHRILSRCKMMEGFPVVISQINFSSKNQVENHCLMLGDAAGMITPLCGNGMSIALHTSKIAAQAVHRFLRGDIDRYAMEVTYIKQWKSEFSNRLHTGRLLQRFFGSTHLSNAFVGLFKTFPVLAKPLIRMTHGKPFKAQAL